MDLFIAFTAKTKHIEHYQNKLGAYTLGGHKNDDGNTTNR